MKTTSDIIVQGEKGTYENIFGAERDAPGIPVVDLRPSVGREIGLLHCGKVLREHLEIVIQDGRSCRTFDLHWKNVEGIYADIAGPKESTCPHNPPATPFTELPDRTRMVHDIFENWTSPEIAVVDILATVSDSRHYLIVGRKEMADHRRYRTYALIGIVPRSGGYVAEVLEQSTNRLALACRWPSIRGNIWHRWSRWEGAAPQMMRDVFEGPGRRGGTAPVIDIVPIVLDGPHHAVVLRHIRGDRQTISVVSWTADGSKTEDFASYADLLAAYPETGVKIAQFFGHNPGRNLSEQE